MRVRFWGVRGSIAKAGPSTVRYGGNTSCVEVRSAGGTLVVLDCGTGAHGLGQALIAEGRPLRGHILLTHTHWDHIQGIPFFAPLFGAAHEWDVYAPRGLSDRIRDTLAGQMQYTYFPVSLDELGARIRYHDLVEGVFTVGDVRVTAQYLNHPALTLGYRLEADGAVLLYATDHEPHAPPRAGGVPVHPGDERHAAFVAGADLLIHDSQYTAAEYPGRIGWGHSPAEAVVDTAMAARVRRLALFHHEPGRDDAALDALLARAREQAAAAGSGVEVLAATEGLALEVAGQREPSPEVSGPDALALSGVACVAAEQTVVLAVRDPAVLVRLVEAIRPEGIQLVTAADAAEATRALGAKRPALVVAERGLVAAGLPTLCRAAREASGDRGGVPVMVVGDGEDPADEAVGVSDWLVWPFSPEYARTRVRACLLRRRARWMRAPVPPDEPRRLAALRRLHVLDTPPEERFDRLTRLAQRLFEVPIAFVSLVDADRQWFKSRQGIAAPQTSREMAFCAHAILQPEALVVPDAVEDPRFADNPLVTDDPRIRFYAGHPLSAQDGSRVGTLCIVDHRPRALGEADLAALRDLARLVEEELAAGAPRTEAGAGR